MIIKCPQCSTGYNIPEKLFTDKPRKMRCSRCQNVFTIARRQEEAPTGYEEFTGKQHLPQEFAFLEKAESQPKPEEPVSPEAAQPDERPPAGLYDSVAGASAEQTDTIPLEPKVVSGPTREPTAPQPEPATPPSTPEEPQQPPPPEPSAAPAQQAPPAAPSPPTPTAEPAPRSSSASDIYGTTSAWEMEAPLELSGYAIAEEQTTTESGQAVGKFMTVIVVLVVIFLVFVAWRNDWSISLGDLPAQIGFAFSGDESDAISSEAREIDVMIADRRLMIADDKTSYLVVTGTVYNGASVGRNAVVLRGRLTDLTGELRDEVRGPCGKMVEDEAIKATAKGAIGGHFRSGGTFSDCVIKTDGDNVFQLIFENVPLDYSPDFNVEVIAVSASAYAPG
ncbi:MAG: zinc-ribbon domain-containing protein [Deltaproteobacteria bacterium]|nr:zinc-ribbon domain-containing protein [Deltaproteobacteria bacterium]